MLLNLSQELLIKIALYLPSSGKLQLALTCKRFKNTVFEQCLYETIDLLPKREKSESIVLLFKRERSKGEKVKILLIDLEYVSKNLLSEILLIFPNVTRFFARAYPREPGYESSYNQFINWKNNLKYFNQNKTNGHYPLLKLLEKNVFSQLMNLDMSPCKIDAHRIDFFECIKNAPTLRDLTVREYTVTIESIEEIHSICPLLFSLMIDSCIMLVTRTEHLHKEIAPALHLSQFKLKATTICDQKGLFLDYLTRKYTNIVQLGFHPDFTEKRYITRVLDHTPFQTNAGPDFTRGNEEVHLTHVSYKMSATNLLSHLPSTLKLLKTSSLNLYNPMNLFSKECVNVTRLELAGTIFTSSEDIRMLRNLPFLKRLLLLIDPWVQEPNTASSSTSVIHLEIIVRSTQPQHRMDIGWLLSTFPSLNDLYIKLSETLLTGSDSNPSRAYPGLVKLSVGPSPADTNLLNYICNAAPKLRDLHWCIFREYEGRVLEDNLVRIITINPHASHIRHYKINLTGFTLDFLRLKVYNSIFVNPQDKVILQLVNGEGKKREFITNGNNLSSCTKASQKKDIDKTIIIVFGKTSKININSNVSINLEELEF